MNLDFLSVGHCPSCPDCVDIDLDMGEEGFFSWQACDYCHSTLGGMRYPAHGRDADGEIVHVDVCVDCVFNIAYGGQND